MFFLLLQHITINNIIHLTPTNKTARQAAKRHSIESAKHFQVNSTIATQTAEVFKKMQDERKAKKNEVIESAKRYNYQLGDGSIVDETSQNFKKMQEERRAAKIESIESAKRYNYTLGNNT